MIVSRFPLALKRGTRTSLLAVRLRSQFPANQKITGTPKKNTPTVPQHPPFISRVASGLTNRRCVRAPTRAFLRRRSRKDPAKPGAARGGLGGCVPFRLSSSRVVH